MALTSFEAVMRRMSSFGLQADNYLRKNNNTYWKSDDKSYRRRTSHARKVILRVFSSKFCPEADGSDSFKHVYTQLRKLPTDPSHCVQTMYMTSNGQLCYSMILSTVSLT